MRDIVALLQPIQNSVSETTICQLCRITVAMIAMTGRVTMLGVSRWTEKGGSYRSVQRFYYTTIPWAQVFWTFFRAHLLDRQDTYLLASDESVVTKTGKHTHGLDYFFSSLKQKKRKARPKSKSRKLNRQLRSVKPDGPRAVATKKRQN